jgi:tetratricopeptide (TPR) repeat protein
MRIRSAIKVFVPLIIVVLLAVSSSWGLIDLQLYKAQEALKSTDYERASQFYVYAAQYAPWRKELWEEAAINSFKGGDYQSAKYYFQEASNTGNLSPMGLTLLGDIARFEGDLEYAIHLWEQAIVAKDDEIELHTRLADAYRRTEDLDKAVLHFSKLIELNPTDSSANYQLGLLLAATEPEASLAYLSHAAELDPELASKTNNLIRDIRFTRNIDDPSYGLLTAGQSLLAIEEWELAEIALSNATRINPEYAEAWAYLGEALQHNGQNGFEEIEKALVIDPNSVAANTLMGLYWQRKEEYDLALIYFHAAANLDDQNPAFQAEIGNTLGLSGNISAAESHYRRATALAPNDPIFWRILADFYIKYETNLREEGLAAARQAVILDPDDPASLDVLAQIYLLLNHPLIARRFLERALLADDKFAPAHLHLGLIHILEGNYLLAFQEFSTARDQSDPDSPISALAIRLLETHFP